jgi:hypothetical protein
MEPTDDLSLIMTEVEIAAEPETDSAFQPMSEEDIENIVAGAVDDAIDFISSEITERRMKAQRYFKGEVDIGFEPNRSKVVSTKCRDIVRAVKPSIQRVFMSAERPVEFIPSGPEDVATMEQASTYAVAKFRQHNGYKILRDVTHDALVSITGFTKAYWSEYDKPKIYNFSGLDDAQFQMILDAPGVDIIQHEQTPDEETIRVMQEQVEQATMMAEQMAQAGQPVDPSQLPAMPDVLPMLHDVRIMRRETEGKLCVETVPPEEFFVDENARSDDDFYVIGHRTAMRVADVIALGVAEDLALELDLDAGADVQSQEGEIRRGYPVDAQKGQDSADPSMRKVTVTEAYMRMDIDGTGTPILHKFLLGGSANKLLSYEPVDDHPFASWHVDPEPHTFFGRSLVELIEQDQDAATYIIRSILDNVTMTNNPRLEVVNGQVEMDDVLNNEFGGIVRVNAPGMLRDIPVPFVAAQTLPALQYLDDMVEVKTGVTRASMGLDPDALQSTTRAAVTATVSAGAGQVEVMVSNLAYTGMRRLFKQILQIMSRHSTRAEMMRVKGEYVAMDPRVWDSDLDATVNVGLGTGREDQKNAILGQVMQIQLQAIQTYGPQNPLAGIDQLRNTLADMMALNGIANAERYFSPPQPPQPPAPEAPPQADPAQAMVQAETIKAQAKMASDSQRLQFEMQKAQMDDDFRRDQMEQDLMIEDAKLQKSIDTEAVKAAQMVPRQFQGGM